MNTKLDLVAIRDRAENNWPTSHDVLDLLDELARVSRLADERAREIIRLGDELDSRSEMYVQFRATGKVWGQ